MKKIILLFLTVLFLTACGGNESSLTMNDFKEAFEKEGIPVDLEEKPMYQMINAKDGVIFHNDVKVVKIYQFHSSEDIKEAKKTYDFMEDWPENGLFVLETNDEKSVEIFNSVK
ncbi:hypothetical protein A0U40_13245 [[Bacillus] sp. KCTC 13219]|nr:hypothetical protein A0U40_13245 [[Bacillus] sp. KCTC 13219]